MEDELGGMVKKLRGLISECECDKPTVAKHMQNAEDELNQAIKRLRAAERQRSTRNRYNP